MHSEQGIRVRRRGVVGAAVVLAVVAALLVLTGGTGYAAGGSSFTWHLDETSGSTMVDSTGGQDGKISNVTLGRSGVSGSAYGFNGSSSRVIVPNADALNPYDADVHISFWLRTSTTPAVPDYDLFRKGEYPGNEYKIEMQPNGQASCDFRGSLGSQSIQNGPDLSDGQWHHIQCDKTATTVSLSVDGQSFSKSKAVGTIANSYDVVVGAYPNGDFYQGDLDEITMDFGARTSTGLTASFKPTSASGTAPFTVAFTDTSSGSPTSWSWDFGDGGTATSQNPSHVFTKAGSYTVRLTVRNSTGSSTATGSVTVKAPVVRPSASFTASPASGTAPLAVAFTDTSTGSPTSWSWNFGDGNTSSEQNPSHTFTRPGSYIVSLTATNTAGSSTVSRTISAGDGTPPVGRFTVGPTDAWAGWTRVVLRQQSLSDDGTSTDQIQRVVHWGDGTSVQPWTAGTALRHVYRSGGRYTPRVELTDQAGNRAVVTLATVTVTRDGEAPTVRLTVPASRDRVGSFRRLQGTVHDGQTGPARVLVKAVEKRHGHWFAYRPARGGWVREASLRAALRHAGWLAVTPHDDTWSHRLHGLRRGRLEIRVTARDHAGNTAPVRGYRFLLRRP